MTVLSYLYGIKMDREINATGHGKNIIDVINATDRRYLKGKWNFLENKQVTTHQVLELLTVHQNMSPLKS